MSTETREAPPGDAEILEAEEAPPSLAARFFNLRTLVSFALGFAIILFLAKRIIDVIVLFCLMAAAASLAFGRALPPEVTLLIQIGFGLVVVVAIGLVTLRSLRPLVLRLLPARLHAKWHSFEHGTLGSFH